MTPNQRGRHCGICSKTVVDFTGMSDEDVKHFFLHKKEESRVCGRFKKDQLHHISIHLPEQIFDLIMPRWKQFLAACLLAFSSMLFSCDTTVNKAETMGMLLPPISATKDSAIQNKIVPNSTTKPTFMKPICTATTGIMMITESALVGDIEFKTEEINSEEKPAFQQADTSALSDSIIFTGMVTSKVLIKDSVQIKDPPAADNLECDSTAINYL